jgi:predicted metal-dependent hydrolase
MNPSTQPIKIDSIIRSKRKTFSLVVKKDGRLVIRAPLFATNVQIHVLVQENEAWIRSKQEQVRNQVSKPAPYHFQEGEEFPFLGKWYSLAMIDQQLVPLFLEDRFYLSKRAQPKAEQIFIQWYRMKAEEVIKERLDIFSAIYAFKFNQVRIKDIRTRWGSCSTKRNLNFNFRLVMAPLNVVDYVIVHELVHLNIQNHSGAFWEEVKKIIPTYKTEKDWLRKFGASISLFIH